MFTHQVFKNTSLTLFFLAIPASAIAGNLYVSDDLLDEVQIFDSSDGAYIGSMNIPSTVGVGFMVPAGIAIGPNGNVFVADDLNDAVQEFSPDGTYVTTFISSSGVITASGMGDPLNDPSGLAFASNGDLYVANNLQNQPPNGNNGYISQFDANGNPINADFVSGVVNPGGMAIGADGNLYIANGDELDQVILTTNPATGTLNPIVTAGCPGTPFTDIQGIAVGSNQNLFVSDEGAPCNTASGVYEYNTSGVLQSTFIPPASRAQRSILRLVRMEAFYS